MHESHADHHEEQMQEPAGRVEYEHEREEVFEAVSPLVVVADLPISSAESDDADDAETDDEDVDEGEADEAEVGEAHASAEPEHAEHQAAANAESPRTTATNGADSHPLVSTGQSSNATHPTAPAFIGAPAAAEARGLLEGIAESLRTLAGREGTDGTAVAIFPRGVDLLEVRMHVARDQAIDLNFRVAGPGQPSLTA